MVEWKVYRQSQTVKGTDAVVTILGEKVPEGYILEITNMGLTDVTTPNLKLEIGYVDVTGEYRVFYIDKRTAKIELHLTGRVYLEAGERPYGRITTAVDGDEIHFNVHGKLWPKG